MVCSLYEPLETPHFDEDARLVEQAAKGEGRAFQRLYERHFNRVFAVCRGVLLDTDDAHDAAQETFTLVYRNLHKFDQRARFSTWLFRIALNRAVQEARRLKYRRKAQPLDAALSLAAPPVERHGVDPDPKVDACLNAMSPADRAVLTFFYWEDLSLQEIAEVLECSPNAAKTRLFRARERFRELYRGEGQ
ncbi:MAG: RNA polymerase sigma factor [Fimbriimonadaceae bacterium]|nr:RNA polymerase sigma factor [Fimbriimonadaceae bacterium]QYK55347.1 MAG: RNA polymerase sigma factor [Fimbriimonadaceae bacterium]